jgi:hypothetical protein
VLSCDHMSLRTRTCLCGWLAGVVWATGCGDVAALAEPAAERTAWADLRGGYAVAGDIGFADGLRVGTRVFAGVPIERGVSVEFPVAGLVAGSELAVGVRAPRAAGRQVVAGQSRRVVGGAEDPRDRWVTATIDGDRASATIELADGWHPRHAVVVLAVTRDGEVVPARAGPRMDRGAGVLGVVPVATRPTQVTANAGTPEIDGVIDDSVWAGQAGTLLADSLDGEPDPEGAERGTRVWFAWDEGFLYAAARLPDHDLWTDYVAQDDPLYKQEAFELFVAGSGEGTRYLEFQVSARGVTFDARFATHRKGDEAWDSSWRTAVAIDGTLEAGDRDRGWTAEVAVPWAELCEHTAIACPPRPGMRVRVNAFRLERPDRKRTSALALSPTRVPDFHAWQNAAELELQ